MLFGLGLDRADPDYRGGIEGFPDPEDRIRLAAAMVARCGLFCARTEAEVKNRYANTRTDPDTCWPQDVRQELVRHEDALSAYLASRSRKPVLRKLRPLRGR